MTIQLPYGKSFMNAELPDSFSIDEIKPQKNFDLPDPEKSFIESIKNPVGSKPLKELLPENGNILVLLSDITRKDNKKESLRLLINYLSNLGIQEKRIHLLFCRGTHREMTVPELETMVGEETLRRCVYFQHDCDGKTGNVGTTSHGTPVEINSLLFGYPLIIVYSGIVHHYFAGFGGGRKMVVPGAAGRITIQKSHELVFLSEKEGGGRRPGVEAGRMEGNEVSEDFDEAVRMANLPLFHIASIKGSKAGSFTGFWSGDIFGSHRAACKAYMERKAYGFEEPYDLVIASSGGYPLDVNLIQTHKGLDNAFRLVKPGGHVIYLSACQDGIGGEDLEGWIAMETLDEIRQNLYKRYKIYGQTVYSIKEKAHKAKFTFITGLPEKIVRQLHMAPCGSLEKALEAILKVLPKDCKIALMPDAGQVLPVRK